MIRSEQIAKLKEELALHEQTEAAYAAWQKNNSTQLQYEWAFAPMGSEKGWRDMGTILPGWCPLENCHYRIKPTPKLRPWTKDEARGKWVRPISNRIAELMITEFISREGEVRAVLFGETTVSFTELLQYYEQLDGSPCGAQE